MTAECDRFYDRSDLATETTTNSEAGRLQAIITFSLTNRYY